MDDDISLAGDLLREFYGRRCCDFKRIDDHQLLLLASVHANLALADANRRLVDRFTDWMDV